MTTEEYELKRSRFYKERDDCGALIAAAIILPPLVVLLAGYLWLHFDPLRLERTGGLVGGIGALIWFGLSWFARDRFRREIGLACPVCSYPTVGVYKFRDGLRNGTCQRCGTKIVTDSNSDFQRSDSFRSNVATVHGGIRQRVGHRIADFAIWAVTKAFWLCVLIGCIAVIILVLLALSK